MYRHNPQTARLSELVRDGAIGELRVVRSAFSYALYDEDNIRLRTDVEGGSLMDVGCYCVSGSRLLAGEPESVFGQAYVGPTGTDWLFTASLRFPGDVLGLFDCGTSLAERDELEAIGTEGSLFLDDPWHCTEPVIELRREGTIERIELEAVDSYRLRAREPGRRHRRDRATPARARRRRRPGTNDRGPLPLRGRGRCGLSPRRPRSSRSSSSRAGRTGTCTCRPAESTVHVSVPVPLTSVDSSTPGPVRWKLWMLALSSTLIVYVPAVSVLTSLPLASVRLMSKPGPTVPSRVVPVEPPVSVVAVVSVVVVSVVPDAELSSRHHSPRGRGPPPRVRARLRCACVSSSLRFVACPEDTRVQVERFGRPVPD